MSVNTKAFWSFQKARKFIRSLNLRTVTEWRAYVTSGEKPNYIPSNPDQYYKDTGWKGFRDWLNQDSSKLFKGKYRPFKTARIFARSLNLESSDQWFEYSKSNKKPYDIPAYPDTVYKDAGWKDYADWLGIKKKRRGGFLSYEDAKKIVHQLSIKNKDEWKDYSRSGALPDNIPRDPYTVYRNKGYISMG